MVEVCPLVGDNASVVDISDDEVSVSILSGVGLFVFGISLVCSMDTRFPVVVDCVCGYVTPFFCVDDGWNDMECSMVCCVLGVVEDSPVWFP